MTEPSANGFDYDFRNLRDERHGENEMTTMTLAAAAVCACVQRIRLFMV